MSTARQSPHEAMGDRNTRTLERFHEAIKGDVELLDEVCAPEFRLIEPDLFETPFRDLETYRAHVAKGTQKGATFERLEIEPIGEALLVRLRYTPPDSDERQHWRVIWTFWEGKVVRVDGKRIS